MYCVASEGRHRMPASNLAGRNGTVLPAGTIHAIDFNTETVACGVPVSSLFVFKDRPWNADTSGNLCRACKAVVP